MDQIAVQVDIIHRQGENFTAAQAGEEHNQDGQLEPVRGGENQIDFRGGQGAVGTGRSARGLGEFRLKRILAAQVVFDGRIKERDIEHPGALDGAGGISGVMLPDGSGVVNGDGGEVFVSDIRIQSFQLLCVIVIAFLRNAGLIQGQPFSSVFADGQLPAEDPAGFLGADIILPGLLRFFRGAAIKVFAFILAAVPAVGAGFQLRFI